MDLFPWWLEEQVGCVQLTEPQAKGFAGGATAALEKRGKFSRRKAPWCGSRYEGAVQEVGVGAAL